MQILKILFILLEVVILFNLLILVHEWGHFLAARWRGLKVERFGIWFGKADLAEGDQRGGLLFGEHTGGRVCGTAADGADGGF